MLRRLVEKALSLRLVMIGLALVLAGAGAWSFVNLPIDAFPDISSTQVKIILKAPGMTPEEVESRVIAPIEMEMLGIPTRTCCARSPIRDWTSRSTSRTAPISTGRATRWRSA
jgi:cobalt-zinc-cadmium resistance protein CzcA